MPVNYPVEKIIDEEGNVLALVDVSARALLGDDELLTDAKTCTGGINELKQSLTDLIKISTCTVMGNGTKYANNDVTAITGYTAIGVVGYDPSGSFVAGYELAGLSVNISAQKVYATWGVDLGSNAGIIAKVLYVRNGSAS